jgi:hypothetical protein
MELSLKTKKLKYGWRAYIYDGDDLIWITTNYHDTEEEVIECTKKYFCASWTIQQVKEDNERR